MTFKKLAFLVLCASAVPLAAIANNYRSVTISALAEDDCPYVYGSRTIIDVTRDGDHVNCVYR